MTAVLGGDPPRLDPPTPGVWSQTDAEHARRSSPAGSGFAARRAASPSTLPDDDRHPLDRKTQTVDTLTWSVPVGSTLRLHQLLAELGYLPLAGHGERGAGRRYGAPRRRPPRCTRLPGHSRGATSNTPAELEALWEAGRLDADDAGRGDGLPARPRPRSTASPGPTTWHTLIRAALAGERARLYSYVVVHRSVPQTLTLWNDGQIDPDSAKINTGVPAAPTPFGTHPVSSTSRSARCAANPDGSKYVDPGSSGSATSTAVRPSTASTAATYGFPQSVGCVEAPTTTAGKIWPYTPIGTLVSVVP